MARAIWKGRLVFGDEALPVKLYSAVEDRKVRFRLLHAADLTPIEQRIVRKSDGKEVAKEDRRKAFPLDAHTAVILDPGELEKLEPRDSREIDICRFVPRSAIGDPWFDRPYYLGPDKDDADYFALAEALERENAAGVARWVMRKKRYVGALAAIDGYLTIITLRRADQILTVENVETPKARQPEARELELAKQLVSTIAGDFEPQAWKDRYRERVWALIEAKARGEKAPARPAPRKAAGGSLAEQLRRSIGAVKERKVA